jgi:hypothetical protein
MKIPGKKKPTSLHTQKSLLNFFPKIKQEMMKKWSYIELMRSF